MFSRWFKRKNVPNFDGTSSPSRIEKQLYVKGFELLLKNMENGPSYTLTNQLTVGSEVGNIIVNDPSVSPRHATFILQQEVVTVIDHGSVSGTSINGHKISPGKNVILEENDIVNVGDLEIGIQTKMLKVEEVQDQEEVAPVPEEDHEVSDQGSKKDQAPQKPRAEVSKEKKEELLARAQKSNKQTAISSPAQSANALVRVVAVVADLLLSYAVIIILSPFDEFRELLNFIPETLFSLIPTEAMDVIKTFEHNYAMILDVLKNIYSFLSDVIQIGPMILVFILSRLLFTLLIGVSLSEFLLGIRPTGHGIWARIGGVLRVLIGTVTAPFLIFDIPSIGSRRTFKEFVTFTNLVVPSKAMALIGILAYVPALVGVVLVSPLVQGLELQEPIPVNQLIQRRVTFKQATEGTIDQASPVKFTEKSDVIPLDLTWDSSEFSLVPGLSVMSTYRKISYRPKLIFYQYSLKEKVEFEVIKKFDLKELLGIGLRGNPFLYDKFPRLSDFVNSPAAFNTTVVKTMNKEEVDQFAKEIMDFTKLSLTLSDANFLQVMQEQTLFLKGLVDFKSAFLSLIEYKDFLDVGFINIGNISFMKISYLKHRPFDLLIPLVPAGGKLYRVSYDSSKNLPKVSSQLYKFNLISSNWLASRRVTDTDTMSALQVFDLFSTDSILKTPLTSERAQALFGYYYEKSAEVLKRADKTEIAVWKESVKNINKILERIPSNGPQEGEDNPKSKLLQNFLDLQDALENNNPDYFGIQNSQTV